MKNPKQELFLGNFDLAVESRLTAWDEAGVSRRIWEKDGTVWVPNPTEAANTSDLTNRLGWLNIAKAMRTEADALMAFATEVKDDGFKDVVLLGMGGSSLAPEVMMTVFGNAPGYPSLTVLDSTNPLAVQAVADKIDPAKTLFLVSSKSGGTVETLSFFKYFFNIVGQVKSNPGDNFVAITDPGSKLEKLAKGESFRRVFSSPADIGGRYSALTYFGLVPAALMGLDISKLLKRAQIMADACAGNVTASKNPGLILGAAMGELALAARDKLTFIASPGIAPFSVWVEQLIAESTGKRNVGILPVADERVIAAENYRRDRVFVYLRLKGDGNEVLDKTVDELKAAGNPVIIITLADQLDLVQEFFRWEMATAAASIALHINPFDQPDVEAAKIKARELMAAYEKDGELPAAVPVLVEGDIEVYGLATEAESVADSLADLMSQIEKKDYLAVMAYVPATPETDAALDLLRVTLLNKFKIATTVGYGPRFLHSTGQLHKGGNNRGIFIQITHDAAPDVAIPEMPYTFGVLISAQAQGDFQALSERDRRLIRFHFKGDVVAGLKRLAALV